MRVLLLGGGGREHAIAWKIAQSGVLDELFLAPGNGGTQQVATNLDFGDSDFDAMKEAILRHAIDLVVVGPEAPLVKGVRAFIENDASLRHVKIVGPGAEGAQLEGSKSFSKKFMQRHGIPTARFGEFEAHQLDEAKAFLDGFKPPYVLKADGLAAGKGVLILEDKTVAKQELEEMLVGGKFGAAGTKVVIEEFLSGIELSVFALTDGKDYVMLPEAKDYKRIGEGDAGLNTGGMGSISPVPFAKGDFMEKVISRIVQPSIDGLRAEGIAYNGFLFIGLMNVGGDPYVIEYNCRMGDPETESVVPRIKSDLLTTLWKCANSELAGASMEVDPRTAACVMAVSGGYPEAYEKGKVIEGLDAVTDSVVFHAGTTYDGGKMITSGGRVVAFTSYGEDITEALNKCYASLEKVSFNKMYYRKDIGFDLKDRSDS
ncbi:MAG: phosphoribosylamine--glycine ligase [Cryomorphaceae bacterium]